MNLNVIAHQIHHGKEMPQNVKAAVSIAQTAKKAAVHRFITDSEYRQEINLAKLLASK